MKIDTRIATICQRFCACPTRTMTLVIEPGPASIGIPSGTMPASSFWAASVVSSLDSCVGERLASSMSKPMSKRMTPPAISNAGSVIPNMRKIYCPATANARSKRVDQKEDRAQRQHGEPHIGRTLEPSKADCMRIEDHSSFSHAIQPAIIIAQPQERANDLADHQ